MLFLHQLSNKEIFWKLKNKIDRIRFESHKNITLSREGFNSKKLYISILYDFIKAFIFSIFMVLVSIVFLEYVENKSELGNWVHNYLCIKKGFKLIDHKNDLYSDIATIFAAIVGIYFAAVSLIASISYANLSKEIRQSIWREKHNFFFSNYAITIITSSLILAAINNLGYKTGYIIFIVIVFFSLIGILGFLRIASQLFDFFSPTTLLKSPLIPDIAKRVKNATIDGKQWQVPEIQNYYRNDAERNLRFCENIVGAYLSPSDNKLSNLKVDDEISSIVEQILYLTFFYSYNKQRIPTDSYWFQRIFEHKEWFSANSSEVEIALRSEIGLMPKEVPDKVWFEKSLFSIIEKIFEYIKISQNYRLSVKVFYLLQNYLEKIVDKADPETVFLLNEWLSNSQKEFVKEIKLDINKQQEHLIEEKIARPLAAVDCYAMQTVSILIGCMKRVERLSAEVFSAEIKKINWFSAGDIYSHNFPNEVIKQLQAIKEGLNFENSVEGKILSPDWYILQLATIGALEFLSAIPNNTASLLENNIVNFSNILIDKDHKQYFVALQLIDRGFEACSKASLLANRLEETYGSLLKLLKIQDIPYPQVNIDAFRERINKCRTQLVENFGQVSGLTAFLPRHSSIPDYFGRAYWFIAEECVECIINDDSALFKKLFPALFAQTFLVYDRFLKEYQKTKQEYWAIQNMDILIDLYALSGYALIYGELGQKEIWNIVDQQWKNYTSNSNTTSEAWVETIVKIASGRDSFSSISNRQMVRTSWEIRVSRDLTNRKIFSDESSYYVYGKKSRKHQSDIVEILVQNVHLGSWSIDSEDVFVGYYLWKFLPENSNIKPDWKVKSFLNQLSQLRGDNDTQE